MARISGIGILALLGVFFSSMTFANTEAPQVFTYEGRLYDSASNPLAENVTFRIEILNSAQNCLLYEETQVQDLSSSEGRFALEVGSATGAGKRTSDDPGFAMWQVFKNTGSLAVPAAVCPGTPYNPALGEKRKLRVSIKPSSTGVEETLTPNQTITSAPSAMMSQSLQGIGKDGFIQVTANTTQANIETLTDGSDASSLHTHDSLYAKLTGTGSMTFGSQETLGLGKFTTAEETAFTPGLAAGDAGKTWYNSDTNTIMYWDGTAAQAVGTGSAGIASINGDSTSAQLLAVGSTGTAPAWSTAAGTHTLNIPLASTASVTAGLISKTDYDNFSGKLDGTASAGGDLTGNYPNPSIANDAVTSAMILDGQVDTADLADESVTLGKIDGTGAASLQGIRRNAGNTAWEYYTPAGDNLGDHTATTDLQMADNAIYGSSAASGNLTIDSTSDATKGDILLNPSGGNVGVGLTTPLFLLHASESGNAPIGAERTDATDFSKPTLVLERSRSDATAPGTNFGSQIVTLLEGFTDDSNVMATFISSFWENAQTDDTTSRNSAMTFSTMSANTTKEHLRITSSGSIGIGTANPAAFLDISGNNSTTTARFYDQTAGTGKTQVVIRLAASQTAAGSASSPFIIQDNAESPILYYDIGNGSLNSPAHRLGNGSNGIWNYSGLGIRSDATIKWSSTTNAVAAADTGLTRIGAGTLALGNGTTSDATGTFVTGQVKITGGTPGAGKVLTSDATGLASWQALPGGGDLVSTNNLSDVANAATARTNLGLAVGSDVQAYDADLDDLADGTLSAAKVENGGFFIDSAGTAGQVWTSDGIGNGVWTTPTATNTASTIVERDGSGNFSAGTITANLTGNVSGTSANVTGVVAIANGGTGQTTANAAFNALAPSQGSNGGKFLTTDGTNTSWADVVGDNLGNHTATTNLQLAGNTLYGNSAASGDLTLDSTSDATKGDILLNPIGGNVGIGTTAPSYLFHGYKASSATSGLDVAVTGEIVVDPSSAQGAVYSYGTLGYGHVPASASQSVNEVYGVTGIFENASNSTSIYSGFGMESEAFNSGSSPMTLFGGVMGSAYVTNGTVSNAYGMTAKVDQSAGTSVTNEYVLRARSQYAGGATKTNRYMLYLTATGGGTATNDYGVYQETATQNNYFAGNVGIGTTAPAKQLQVSAADTSTQIRVTNSSSTTARFPGVGVENYSNAGGGAAGGPNIYLYSSRGSEASPVAAGATDSLGAINFYGQKSTAAQDWVRGARINAIAQATFSGTEASSDLAFFTASPGVGWDSEKMRITSAGNVGIGTTTPSAALEVAGQVKITGGTPGAGKVLTSDASGLATWEALPGGGDLVSTNNLSDVANAATARTNLGLAIGTNVQAYDADLDDLADGTLSASKVENGGFFIDSAGTAGQVWTSDGIGNGVWTTPTDANTASTIVERDGSGNFSAGTITANLTGNVTGTASNVTGTVAIANGGTGQTTANAAFNALAPSQSSNGGKFLTTDGTNTSWTDVPGDDLGDHTATTNLQLAGNTLYGSSAASGDLVIDSTSDATKGDIILNASGGNVGIGTTTPGFPLQVVGSGAISQIEIGEDDTSGGHIHVRGRASGTTEGGEIALYNAADYDTNSDAWHIDAFSTRFRVFNDLGEKLTISESGNVGIGTTAPVSPLTVSSSVTATGTIGIGVHFAPAVTSDTSGTIGTNLGAYISPSAAVGIIYGNTLIPKLNNSAQNVTSYYGNLMRADTTASYSGDITNLYTTFIAAPTLSGSGTVTNVYGLYQADSASKNYFAGNVGIGTATPNKRLQVTGTAGGGTDSLTYDTALGGLNYLSMGAYGGVVRGLEFDRGTGKFHIFGGASGVDGALTNYLTIDNSGNVGIGTTGPAGKLEVQGGKTYLTNTTAAADAAWTHASLTARDDRAFDQYVGGGITFEGKYNSAGSYSTYGWIRGYKMNATDGSIAGGLLLSTRTGDMVFQTKGAGGTIDDLTTATSMVITSTGNVGIGTDAPAVSLDLAGKTDAIRLPAGTTAQQPASPAAGMIRYNTTDGALEYYNGSTWQAVPGAPEGWSAPTLENSWANFGSGYSVAGYYKDPMGTVHLRGVMTGGSLSTCIFTLPAGYRPAYNMIFPAITDGSPQIGRVDVFTNGCVMAIAGGTVYFSLDAVSFRGEQ